MAKLKITGTVNSEDFSVVIECPNADLKSQMRMAICRLLATSITALTSFEVKEIA